MTTEGTEQKWSVWAGGLIERLKMSAILLNRVFKSGLCMKGGPNKQGCYWTGLTVYDIYSKMQEKLLIILVNESSRHSTWQSCGQHVTWFMAFTWPGHIISKIQTYG